MKNAIVFYPEKRKGIILNVPVICSVTYAKLRMIYVSGLRCNIGQWDYESKRLKRNQILTNGSTSHDFNKVLNNIEDTLKELFKGYTVAPSPEILRTDLKIKLGKMSAPAKSENFFDRFQNYISESDLSDNRKLSLDIICRKLKTCDPQTTFENLNLPKFKTYLSETLSDNSIALHLNGLKSFIRHSILKGYTNINPFQSFVFASEKYGKPIYLSIPERDLLFNATIEDQTLSTVRDIFVFQCLIGCRYGDLQRLKQSNIIDGCIQYIAAKTKEHDPRVANVPLSNKAKIILSRYQLPEGRLLPYMRNDELNIKIKKLFRYVGLNRMVTIKDPETGTEKQIPISDIASTHMARRVFIGGLHKQNVKNEMIASFSGHVKDSKAFSRYYDIDVEEQRAAMAMIE